MTCTDRKSLFVWYPHIAHLGTSHSPSLFQPPSVFAHVHNHLFSLSSSICLSVSNSFVALSQSIYLMIYSSISFSPCVSACLRVVLPLPRSLSRSSTSTLNSVFNLLLFSLLTHPHSPALSLSLLLPLPLRARKTINPMSCGLVFLISL